MSLFQIKKAVDVTDVFFPNIGQVDLDDAAGKFRERNLTRLQVSGNPLQRVISIGRQDHHRGHQELEIIDVDEKPVEIIRIFQLQHYVVLRIQLFSESIYRLSVAAHALIKIVCAFKLQNIFIVTFGKGENHTRQVGAVCLVKALQHILIEGNHFRAFHKKATAAEIGLIKSVLT